jgi:hypothetical protein
MADSASAGWAAGAGTPSVGEIGVMSVEAGRSGADVTGLFGQVQAKVQVQAQVRWETERRNDGKTRQERDGDAMGDEGGRGSFVKSAVVKRKGSAVGLHLLSGVSSGAKR